MTPKRYSFEGVAGTVTEVHLVGNTQKVPESAFSGLPAVRRVVRVSEKYRLIGRHGRADEAPGFEYNGVHFDERRVHLFAGLCAVDTREHVEQTMSALRECGISTTRMGAW